MQDVTKRLVVGVIDHHTGRHHMDPVRFDAHADLFTHSGTPCALYHDLIITGQHCRDLIIHAFKDRRIHNACNLAFLRSSDQHVLRAHYHIHTGILRHIVHTGKRISEKTHRHRRCHASLKNITLADKISHESILRLVVDFFRRPDLLDCSIRHDYDFIRHGKRFFLIMRHIDKGDPQLVMHGFQFQLHLLAHLQIQCAQRLIKEQDIRFINNRPGNGDALLLSAGKRGYPPLFKPFQIHDFQYVFYLLPDLFFRQVFQIETERDIIINIQVREQRIPLEYRIDRPSVGRELADVFAV